MNTILDFFLEPYKTASLINIILEFIAASLGIASVWFAKKENVLVFPLGIISTTIYIYLLFQWNLFGDLIINIYYTLMSFFGWYAWSRSVDSPKKIPIQIAYTNSKEKLIAFAIFISAATFVIFIYRHYAIIPNQLNFQESINFAVSNLSSRELSKFRLAVPFLDTFTTATAFVAMWLITIKKIENWAFWIITNVISIPLYFVKGYGFTGIQYTVFLILAIQGYLTWKKNLDKSLSI